MLTREQIARALEYAALCPDAAHIGILAAAYREAQARIAELEAGCEIDKKLLAHIESAPTADEIDLALRTDEEEGVSAVHNHSTVVMALRTMVRAYKALKTLSYLDPKASQLSSTSHKLCSSATLEIVPRSKGTPRV